jgi:hypothetical protein
MYIYNDKEFFKPYFKLSFKKCSLQLYILYLINLDSTKLLQTTNL